MSYIDEHGHVQYPNLSAYKTHSSSYDSIKEMCDNSRDDVQTINAIRNICHEMSTSRSDSAPINSIRQICDSSSRHDSASTIDAIREICDKQQGQHRPCSETQRSCYGGDKFQSIVTPVTDLTPQYSGQSGSVEFRMRRKNKSVLLQWEPFSGIMAASGVAYLNIPQSISNLPPYPINHSITIRYRDVNRQTYIMIDPHTTNGNIRIFLNEDGTGTGVNIGDSFYVYASSVSWIVD